MKKQRCFLCNRETVPALRLDSVSYQKKKRSVFKGYKLVAKVQKLYFCSKCLETWKAMTVNNIAVKTSDIMDE